MKRTIACAAFATAGLLIAVPASAYSTFFGQDLNGSATVPLPTTPNSTAAETAFKAKLTGVGTENFETQTVGAGPGLILNFPGAGTATLNGNSGVVCEPTPNPGICNNATGRYSVPGGTKYWGVAAGGGSTFQVDFSQDVAAFGFYGIDIGDFGGSLSIELLGASSNSLGKFDVPAQEGSDGNVLYFGLLANAGVEAFRHVVFSSTAPSGDGFAFDSFTVGSLRQVVTPSVPEPASLALVGLALAGLGMTRRRRN